MNAPWRREVYCPTCCTVQEVLGLMVMKVYDAGTRQASVSLACGHAPTSVIISNQNLEVIREYNRERKSA